MPILKALINRKKQVLAYTLFTFLSLSLLYSVVSLWINYNSNLVKGQEMLKRNQYFVQSVGTVVTSRLTRIVSDVLYIKDSFESIDNDEDPQHRNNEILKQWLIFSERKKVYDQIRYIDSDGFEILRVDYKDGVAHVISNEQLQNKSDRYYFKDAIHLPENHIYISCLDLNMENGKIENPIKPMIRLAIPVYNAGRQSQGLIVLNYLGSDLLQQIKNIVANNSGAFYMLNADGYWLFNSEDSNKDWAFMYQDLASETFSKYYPEEWESIQQSNTGTIITGNGAFVYNKVFASKAYEVDSEGYPLTLGSGDWYIVSHTDKNSESGIFIHNTIWSVLQTTLSNEYYIYIMILLISFVIAVLIGMTKLEQDKIKYHSEYDAMTGALNRRAGLEIINRMYITNSEKRCQISICFMDINGLKEINDFLGHEMGDELIRSVISTVKTVIRENDIIVRMGGDEFLIVFEGLEEQQSEVIWSRIVSCFEEINKNENRDYLISVSHGIEVYRCNASQYIDSIINSADAKMYTEKRMIKKDLQVIRRLMTENNASGNA